MTQQRLKTTLEQYSKDQIIGVLVSKCDSIDIILSELSNEPKTCLLDTYNKMKATVHSLNEKYYEIQMEYNPYSKKDVPEEVTKELESICNDWMDALDILDSLKEELKRNKIER